jgi:hypothetical protein
MSPDESLQTAIRLALVCPLRLHALTGRGPQTVEHLLHRQIHEAIINALGLTQAGPVALAESAEPADHATHDRSTCPAIICCCFAASDLRAWLNNDRDWTAAASAVGHRLPAAGICAAHLGRRIEAVHIDVGYPDTGAIFADLLLNSGDILQLDCRDHVTGYDHALTATSPDDESLDRTRTPSLHRRKDHRRREHHRPHDPRRRIRVHPQHRDTEPCGSPATAKATSPGSPLPSPAAPRHRPTKPLRARLT